GPGDSPPPAAPGTTCCHTRSVRLRSLPFRLPPPNDRTVCSTESNINCLILQFSPGCGKLCLFIIIDDICITGELCPAKSAAFCHFIQQCAELLCFPPVLLPIECNSIFQQNTPVFFRSRNYAVHFRICKFRQDQIVNLIKRYLFKGKITSPFEIRNNISHKNQPSSFFIKYPGIISELS